MLLKRIPGNLSWHEMDMGSELRKQEREGETSLTTGSMQDILLSEHFLKSFSGKSLNVSSVSKTRIVVGE